MLSAGITWQRFQRHLVFIGGNIKTAHKLQKGLSSLIWDLNLNKTGLDEKFADGMMSRLALSLDKSLRGINAIRTLCTGMSCPASRFPEKMRYYQRSLGYEQGSLTDEADWSYADGTPSPLTGGRREERVKQMKLAKKIIQLLWEVDYAVERQRKAEFQREEEKRMALENQLKPTRT